MIKPRHGRNIFFANQVNYLLPSAGISPAESSLLDLPGRGAVQSPGARKNLLVDHVIHSFMRKISASHGGQKGAATQVWIDKWQTTLKLESERHLTDF